MEGPDPSHGPPSPSGLFQGRKFWLSLLVPCRSSIKELIQQNGGQDVPLEQMADVMLADHKRPHKAPTGSYSFEYVTKSVNAGKLLELESYRLGPPQGTVREVASGQPTKATRTRFTAEDDQILYDWVWGKEREGKRVLGNEIYQELERINPRHTSQSWLDRWKKYVSHLPRPSTNDNSASARTVARSSSENRASGASPRPSSALFTKDDLEFLLNQAGDIVDLTKEYAERFWTSVAGERAGLHTGPEWRHFFHMHVKPIHIQRIASGHPAASNLLEEVSGKTKAVVESTTSLSAPPTSLHPISGSPSLTKRKRMESDELRNPDDMTQGNGHAGKRRQIRAITYREIPSTPDRDLDVAAQGSQTLTEPPVEPPCTQDILQNPIDPVDLTIPEPMGGWAGNLPSDVPQSGTTHHPLSRGTQAMDTQAILTGTLPTLAFDIPGPEGGWDLGVADEPPGGTEADRGAVLGQWMDELIVAGMAEDDVILALKCTSMQLDLAHRVLFLLNEGHGIPTDTRGVWTAEDDKAIQGTEGKAISRVMEKHGEKAVEERWKFLGAYHGPEG